MGAVAFVYVESTTYGDGLLLIAMTGRKAFDFIPLSGAPFPAIAGQSAPPAFRSSDVQPPMVFSRDGRLLYVGVDQSLLIVNAEEHVLVRGFADMPAPFNALARNFPGTLEARLAAINAILSGAAGTGARAISSLALSPTEPDSSSSCRRVRARQPTRVHLVVQRRSV
jgi:hypothetical protein